MIVFKKNEVINIGSTPVRFFAQNQKEYLFFILDEDRKTTKELIKIPTAFIEGIQRNG